jgi:hypothetical protein
MPYISAKDRPPIDEKTEAVADELASKLSRKLNGDTEISLCYKQSFLDISNTLRRLEEGRKRTSPRRKAEQLAHEIFVQARKHGYRGAWLGAFDYALTRLIQSVPAKMVEKRKWNEAFRFWVYAQTVGALERTTMIVHSQGKDDWITDALVGVLTDVKDEYKRRVNAAYEAFQIEKSGDCFDTRYRTDLVSVKDREGKVIGYQEIMKDFGAKD